MSYGERVTAGYDLRFHPFTMAHAGQNIIASPSGFATYVPDDIGNYYVRIDWASVVLQFSQNDQWAYAELAFQYEDDDVAVPFLSTECHASVILDPFCAHSSTAQLTQPFILGSYWLGSLTVWLRGSSGGIESTIAGTIAWSIAHYIPSN